MEKGSYSWPLQTDIFLHYFHKMLPEFSTFFLNSTAHLLSNMHTGGIWSPIGSQEFPHLMG
jgi:hypothetical protein